MLREAFTEQLAAVCRARLSRQPLPVRGFAATNVAREHAAEYADCPTKVDVILLKLVITPVLILAASLAGRRWGEAVGGWFVGLPLTSGPVCLFIAIEQGPRFAAVTALGSLAGVAAEAGFCLAYSIAARRTWWPTALGAASIAYSIGAVLFAFAGLSMWSLLAAVIVVLIVVLLLIPAAEVPVRVRVTPPRWDLPARMVIAGTLVLGLTEAAPTLGRN